MTKLALRVKRRFSDLRGRGNRQTRSKTFKSEEAAQAWAKKEGIESFAVENIRSSEATVGKYRIVQK